MDLGDESCSADGSVTLGDNLRADACPVMTDLGLAGSNEVAAPRSELIELLENLLLSLNQLGASSPAAGWACGTERGKRC